MSNNSSNSAEQFHAVEELLTRWLKERRAVLGRYTEVAAACDGHSMSESLESRQQRLCETLIDYASTGHFEVFHKIISEAESFADGTGVLAEKIMPAIGDTTEIILAYQEKYAESLGDLDNLKRDLSALGEILESRFTLEDKLIAGLHYSHRRMV